MLCASVNFIHVIVLQLDMVRSKEEVLKQMIAILDGEEFGSVKIRTFEQLHYEIQFSKGLLREVIDESHNDGTILRIPMKRQSRWAWYYYLRKRKDIPIRDRLEEIFNELEIPPWIDTTIKRGNSVLFVGEYGKNPGFSIIDYNFNPPLIFKNKKYGGKSGEITFYKHRSKYKCIKNGETYWYNLHGKQIN